MHSSIVVAAIALLSAAASANNLKTPRHLGDESAESSNWAYAVIGQYPGNDADLVGGTVVTRQLDEGGILFAGALTFPDMTYAAGESGGVHVHAGVTCDDVDEVYFHFCPWYGADFDGELATGPYSCPTSEVGLQSDPWTTTYTLEEGPHGTMEAHFDYDVAGQVAQLDGQIVVDGVLKQDVADYHFPTFSVSSDKLYDVLGHAVVVHEPVTGTRIGCGILKLAQHYSGQEDSDEKRFMEHMAK